MTLRAPGSLKLVKGTMLKTKLGILLLVIPFLISSAATALAANFNFPQSITTEVNPWVVQEKQPVTSKVLLKYIPQALKIRENIAVPERTHISPEKKLIDNRIKILQAYLAQYNSPLENQAHVFVAAADKYDLDWKLVAAISGVESTFGKFVPGGPDYGSYNAWGWGVYGTQALYFKSWEDGIYTVSQGLKENYIDRGLTDPYAINRVYASSPTWGAHVSYFLADMNKFEQSYNQKAFAQNTPDLITQVAASSGLLALR